MQTVISFLVVDKNFYQLNKTNKTALIANQKRIALMMFESHITELAHDIIRRIVRKRLQVQDNEMLISRFEVGKIAKDNISKEEIEYINNKFIRLEKKQINSDNIAKLLNKQLKNYDTTLN